MSDSTELPALREQAAGLASMVAATEIKTEADLAAVSDRIKDVKTFRVAVEEKRYKTIDPAKAIIDEAKRTYDPIIAEAKAHEANLKQMGVKYVQDKKAQEKKDEDAILARVGEGKGHIKEETAVRKLDEMPRQAATLRTGSSEFQVKEVRDFEITDESLIPEEYFDRTLNRSRLRAAVVTAKLEVPGTKVVIKSQAAIR